MGKLADENAGLKRLPRWLFNETELDTYLARTYTLQNEPELLQLIERIDGLVMRDQLSLSAVSSEEAKQKRNRVQGDQRKRSHKSAIDITRYAKAALESLAALKSAQGAFEHDIGGDTWSAVILAEVFDIDYIPSTDVEPPEVFDSVRLAFRQAHWARITSDLTKIANLPVRTKLRTNVVRHHVLEQALRYIHEFWTSADVNRSWTRNLLADRRKSISSISEDKNILLGDCERFVADALAGCGVAFTWQELNSAWVAVDRRLAGASCKD